jgi:beta-glucosidase
MKNTSSALALMLLVCVVTSCKKASRIDVRQPVLKATSAKILEADGLQFKDLNKNGTLDRYEDWRLSTDERSKDLLARMSTEEKVGFMLISTTRMKNDWAFEKPKNTDPITSDFNEDDLVTQINMFTRDSLPYPIMSAAGTTKAVTQSHLRHFILRASVSAALTAAWSNKLQALCESTSLGIPAIVASNPRNHISARAAGTSLGQTAFSVWPGELGLSAMRDLKLTRTFADIARQEWAAVGLRKGYMYMADLATEPRWQRIDGTFGENAEWAAQMMTEIVLGFQGDSLSNTSVAMTTKHFPGGGAGEGGQDPHFPWGKTEVFPGEMFENNLIPFKAAIKAGTSAMMPYYSLPKGLKYEEIAYAYNKAVLQDLLRGELGFKGIINSDTGPIEMMPWGAEGMSINERYKRTLEAGVNIYSGTADPTKLLETVKSGLVDMSLVDNSVLLLLKEKFALGLFENPYVDEDAATKITGSKTFQEQADIALRKSIVLLRNEKKLLPLKEKTKVYFETYQKSNDPTASPSHIYNGNRPDLEFVDKPEKADVILLWVKPGGTPLFGSTGAELTLSLSTNGVDTKYINALGAKKPTILVMHYSSPWVIDEIYNDKDKRKIAGVLATFGTTDDALLDIVTGKFNPSGKMPFTTPASNKAVKSQKEDVPGYLEGDGYALFKYDEGLSF